MSESKIRVLALTQSGDAQIKALREWFCERAEFIFDETSDSSKIAQVNPDLVLLTHLYLYQTVRCIDEARRRKIPTLFLQDGILEWRCKYENPLFGAGGGSPQHQPVLTDKIACIGLQSARQIALWGNSKKVEVTGMPRLDPLLAGRHRPPTLPGNKILIMTARKPWFNPEQERLILQSLVDVRDTLKTMPHVQAVWRLTRDISGRIGVPNQLLSLEGDELSKTLEGVDSVITTPSTAGVEAMAMNRPTAFLDYPNVPRFVPTAWTISSPAHIRSVIEELLNPAASKLAFQKDSLADVLRTDCPASNLVGSLILKMSEMGRQARTDLKPLILPGELIPMPKDAALAYHTPLKNLYPNAGIFSESDPEKLQIRLARAEKENEQLRMNLRSRSLGYWMEIGGRHLAKFFKQSKREK